MDFSSILLQKTRVMAVLRNLFALLVSVDVMYCQHTEEILSNIDLNQASTVPVPLPCHWALGVCLAILNLLYILVNTRD